MRSKRRQFAAALKSVGGRRELLLGFGDTISTHLACDTYRLRGVSGVSAAAVSGRRPSCADALEMDQALKDHEFQPRAVGSEGSRARLCGHLAGEATNAEWRRFPSRATGEALSATGRLTH